MSRATARRLPAAALAVPNPTHGQHLLLVVLRTARTLHTARLQPLGAHGGAGGPPQPRPRPAPLGPWLPWKSLRSPVTTVQQRRPTRRAMATTTPTATKNAAMSASSAGTPPPGTSRELLPQRCASFIIPPMPPPRGRPHSSSDPGSGSFVSPPRPRRRMPEPSHPTGPDWSSLLGLAPRNSLAICGVSSLLGRPNTQTNTLTCDLAVRQTTGANVGKGKGSCARV